MLAGCASASSTTACSPTPSAAPSAGIATSPSAWRRTGHEVTYLTLRQWERGEQRELDARVRVRRGGPAHGAVHRRRAAADPAAARVRRSACSWHLLRHGRRYDVVHTCAFPYFSLLAAALAAPADAATSWSSTGSRCGAAPTGASTSGGAAGASATLVQRLCARVPQRAFCFSELHAARLREEGLRGEVTVLRGRRTPARRPQPPRSRGARRARWCCSPARLIPEKQAPLGGRRDRARGRADRGAARASSSATGPSAAALRAAIAEHGLQRTIVARPGFADAETVDAEMRRAMCMLLPSRREGYGMVVVEAAARGHPERRGGGRGQRGDRADRGGRQRHRRRRAPTPRGDRRGDRARARGGRGAAREHRALVRRERRAPVAGVLAGDGAGELRQRARRSSRASGAPCAPR